MLGILEARKPNYEMLKDIRIAYNPNWNMLKDIRIAYIHADLKC